MYQKRRHSVSLATAIAILCVLLNGAIGGRAFADTAGSAKDLYTAGRVSYNLGHYDEALKQFEAAYRIKQDPAFLFNIAQCMRNLNRFEDASRTYKSFVRETPGIDDATRAKVQKLIAEMDAAEENRKKQAAIVAPPTTTETPVVATTQPATTAPSGAAVLVATAPERPSKTPVYKKWWLWTIVGVVAVGAGVGIGLGVTHSNSGNNLPGVTF